MKSKITLLAMCITICFALITKKSTAQFNGCSNAAFEDTTFTGWTGATGNCSNYPTPTVWTNGIVSHGINALANDILSQQTLLTDPNGYDPNAGLTGGVPNITYLAPGGGNVSVRLGNSAVGAGTEKLDYRIAVTPQNVRFSIIYALVLENAGGHTTLEAPRFQVQILDQQGNPVAGPCGGFSITSDSASRDPSFRPYYVSGVLDGYYKPWTSTSIDLTPWIGQGITIEFTTQDCTLGGHYGYAYIDASCNYGNQQLAYCPNDTTALLIGQSGFDGYQWYDSTANPIAIPGATSDTLVIHNPVLGKVYTLKLSSYSGCSYYPFTYTIAHTNIGLFCLPSYVTCNGTNDGSAYVYPPRGAQGPFTYIWIDSSTSANITPAINPNHLLNVAAGTYYVTAQSISGCAATDTVHIGYNYWCNVWPGDADGSRVVDNNDLLPIGIYYGQTGIARATISNSWQAYISTNWGITQTGNVDIKNVDCNGDGIIDNNDTLAVNLNFNLTHYISTYNNSGIKTFNPDLYFVTSSNSYNSGDMVDVEVWAGKSTLPVNNLYGVAFNVQYDASLVQPGTESITYPASWLGTPGTDAIKISKIDALSNIAYGGITRINHSNASGFGKIADFKFQVKSSVVNQSYLHLSVANYKADSATGGAMVFNTINDSVLINASTVGIQEYSNAIGLTIFPNPFTSQTTISFYEPQKNTTIKITDILGKEIKVLNFSGKNYVIEKGEMQAGIYFVQITTSAGLVNENVMNRKIVVQ